MSTMAAFNACIDNLYAEPLVSSFTEPEAVAIKITVTNFDEEAKDKEENEPQLDKEISHGSGGHDVGQDGCIENDPASNEEEEA
jgi:hypothetical protein